jgi:hypothetical protein
MRKDHKEIIIFSLRPLQKLCALCGYIFLFHIKISHRNVLFKIASAARSYTPGNPSVRRTSS